MTQPSQSHKPQNPRQLCHLADEAGYIGYVFWKRGRGKSDKTDKELPLLVLPITPEPLSTARDKTSMMWKQGVCAMRFGVKLHASDCTPFKHRRPIRTFSQIRDIYCMQYGYETGHYSQVVPPQSPKMFQRALPFAPIFQLPSAYLSTSYTLDFHRYPAQHRVAAHDHHSTKASAAYQRNHQYATPDAGDTFELVGLLHICLTFDLGLRPSRPLRNLALRVTYLKRAFLRPAPAPAVLLNIATHRIETKPQSARGGKRDRTALSLLAHPPSCDCLHLQLETVVTSPIDTESASDFDSDSFSAGDLSLQS
ncbi:hypothetical protein CSAL01_02105 [Colletotrichum salicis]|uniref:Uncharacterized protein n=1 Tax=Colletotrichum salicis TaxID=1209931 RepID=A0A135V642_9PEZI|nr:hypothetical protein CSAL01_02105 [Colletotrichum salicis]